MSQFFVEFKTLKTSRIIEAPDALRAGEWATKQLIGWCAASKIAVTPYVPPPLPPIVKAEKKPKKAKKGQEDQLIAAQARPSQSNET